MTPGRVDKGEAVVVILILAIAFLVLLFATFRPPDSPRLDRLLLFLTLLGVSGALGYFFLVKVLGWNPNPLRASLAHTLTEHKFIDLSEMVPGVFDPLDYIRRIDTDGRAEENPEEWVLFYKYDVRAPEGGVPQGPFGAAIYDYDSCRPPAIRSFELVPVSYDYVAEDYVDVTVENIIPYSDLFSGGQDRPEVIVLGVTRGTVTDLNVFRKTGVELDCLQMQQWATAHPGEAFPSFVRYDNIGSFRGNYRLERTGSTITVVDRAGFERSQFTLRRSFRPENGSYFQPGTQVLLDPVEYSLAFGPGQPDEVSQVYYPEKAILAFYLNLTKDKDQLEQAQGYLSQDAQAIYSIETDPFGLAMTRRDLARVLVWEIRYEPNVEAERLHQDRQVTVTVVGVDEAGAIDYARPCQVTWGIIGVEKPGAVPYDCEWRLDWYQSDCIAGK
jgi:hypothetical protein